MINYYKKSKRGYWIWLEKILAILALLNFLLVIFDLTYIPLRDFWLQGRAQVFIKLGTFEKEIPEPPLKILPVRVTDWYDWVKGIEPNRFTENYLATANRFQEQVKQIPLENNPEAKENLAELRQLSTEMIANNPFLIANKTGTLERIKNKIRLHVFGNKSASANQAFQIFWSPANLINNYQQELDFFNNEIRPLLETNYYRPVGENGEFVDNFGLLDLPFFLIFLSDFIIRTWWISRRHTGVSWFDAMLWRWYDIFLLIPVFRWLRIIPVIVRLSQAELIDLRSVRKQFSQGFVGSIAEDVTEVVVIQVINQLQNSIRRGEISNLLSVKNKSYIDLNNLNETTEIIKIIIQVTIQEVLPKLEPDIKQFLQYNLDKTLPESALAQLPGAKKIRENLTEGLSQQIYQSFYGVLYKLTEEDALFDELLQKLVENFLETMGSELRTTKTLDTLESLVSDLLEELKVNYIQRLSQEDIEAILEQSRRLKQLPVQLSVVKQPR